MAVATLTVRIKVAWWLRWYVAGLLTVSRITGAEPDMAKVERVVRRAVRLEAR